MFSSHTPGTTGNAEHDYREAEEPLAFAVKQPLDRELIEQLQRTPPQRAAPVPEKHTAGRALPALRLADVQVQSLAGLFPEISRAWMTMDSQLYVWDFLDG